MHFYFGGSPAWETRATAPLTTTVERTAITWYLRRTCTNFSTVMKFTLGGAVGQELIVIPFNQFCLVEPLGSGHFLFVAAYCVVLSFWETSTRPIGECNPSVTRSGNDGRSIAFAERE